MAGEDFESVALGLQAPKAKGKVEANQHVALSDPELQRISTFPNSLDYNITLKILEGIIEVMETEHLKVWKDKETFERTGLVAVAARTMYERYQREVNFFVAQYHERLEAQEISEEASKMTPLEILQRGFGI